MEEITYVCNECWSEHSKQNEWVGTVHEDFCDICWELRRVAHIENYDYLRGSKYEVSYQLNN